MEPMEQAVVVSTVFTAIAFVFLILRCISRFLIVRQIGADDILAICGTLTSVAFLVFMFEIMNHGGGNYFNTLSPENQSGFLKWFFTSVLGYAFGITVTKGSALLQFLRFIKLGRMRTFCWFMVGIIFGFGVISIFVNLLSCRPLSAIWDRSITHATCIKFPPWFWVWAFYVILTDIIIVAIPIVTLKDMNLPYRQKVALIVVFAFGGLACLISFIRLPSVHRFATTGSDWSRHEPDLAMWSHLELNIGLICIHTPPLKAIVIRLVPNLLQESSVRDEFKHSQDSGLSGDTLATSHSQSLKLQKSYDIKCSNNVTEVSTSSSNSV